MLNSTQLKLVALVIKLKLSVNYYYSNKVQISEEKTVKSCFFAGTCIGSLLDLLQLAVRELHEYSLAMLL